MTNFWDHSKIEGPLLNDLKNSLDGYGNVVFTGRVLHEELVSWYSTADLFVFPSVTDTFGMVILEAQACGLPALVTNVGGPQEFMFLEKEISLQLSIDQLTTMASLVKSALDNSLSSLVKSDILQAQNVINGDKVINSFEIDVDNSSYSIFTVKDIPEEVVRQVLAIQKINSILERIGDHAVNIAESSITLISKKSNEELFEIPSMSINCQKNLQDAL